MSDEDAGASPTTSQAAAQDALPPAAPDGPSSARSLHGFSGRVGVLLTTQILTAGIGVLNGLLLARLLGPSAKGDYYLVVLLPTTMMVLLQLGLPQAFGFFAARGQTRGAVIRTLTLTGLLSSVALGVALAVLPLLRETFLRGPDTALIVAGLLALPLALNATMTTDIIVGRQAVWRYAAVQISYTVAATILLVALLGILRLGVPGAVAAFLLATAFQAVAFLAAAVHVTREVVAPQPVSYRQLLHFGLPLYPGSLALFFSARADVYLLALLLASPSGPLGYYSLSVSLAEMVFFIPNAVASLFFPHVAGAPREASDREVASVARVTLLLTTVAAFALAPAGTLLVILVLPAFMPSLPALYVLLPGVVALSTTKVLSGYVSGLGRTGLTSAVNASAFGLNIVANVVLIPVFGIVGAAAASVLSYSASSVAFTAIASRLACAPASEFWMPRTADVRLAARSVAALARRMHPGSATRS